MPKFFISNSRPLADPENAALGLMEHARAFEPPQHGWIDIEQLRHPSFSLTRAPLPNIAQALNTRSRRAGWSCMKANIRKVTRVSYSAEEQNLHRTLELSGQGPHRFFKGISEDA